MNPQAKAPQSGADTRVYSPRELEQWRDAVHRTPYHTTEGATRSQPGAHVPEHDNGNEHLFEVRRDDEHGLIRPWILLIDGIVQRNAVGHIRTFATESAALAAGRAAFSSDKGADRG